MKTSWTPCNENGLTFKNLLTIAKLSLFLFVVYLCFGRNCLAIHWNPIMNASEIPILLNHGHWQNCRRLSAMVGLGRIRRKHAPKKYLCRWLRLSATYLCHSRGLRLYSRGKIRICGIRMVFFCASIYIGRIYQTDTFPAGISHWKSLNHHLFIYSPILSGLVNQLLRYRRDLIACLLTIIDKSLVPSDVVSTVN